MSSASQVSFVVLYVYVDLVCGSLVVPERHQHGVKTYYHNAVNPHGQFDHHKGQRTVNLGNFNHKGNDLNLHEDNYNNHKIHNEKPWSENDGLGHQNISYHDFSNFNHLKNFSNFNLDLNHEVVNSLRKYILFHSSGFRPKPNFNHDSVNQNNHPNPNLYQRYGGYMDDSKYREHNVCQDNTKNYKSNNLHNKIDNDLNYLINTFVYYLLKENQQKNIFSHQIDQSKENSRSFNQNEDNKRQNNLYYQGGQQRYIYGNKEKNNFAHQKDQQDYNSLYGDHSNDRENFFNERYNLNNFKEHIIPYKIYASDYYDNTPRFNLGHKVQEVFELNHEKTQGPAYGKQYDLNGHDLVNRKEHQRNNPGHQQEDQNSHDLVNQTEHQRYNLGDKQFIHSGHQGKNMSNGRWEQNELNLNHHSDLSNELGDQLAFHSSHKEEQQAFLLGHQEDPQTRKIQYLRNQQGLNSGYQGIHQNIPSRHKQEHSSSQNKIQPEHDLDYQRRNEIIFQHRDHPNDRNQQGKKIFQENLGNKSGYQNDQHVSKKIQEIQPDHITRNRKDQQKYNAGHKNQQNEKFSLPREQHHNLGLNYYQQESNIKRPEYQRKYNLGDQEEQKLQSLEYQKTYHDKETSERGDRRGHPLKYEEEHTPSNKEHQKSYYSSHQNDMLNLVNIEDRQGHDLKIQENQQEYNLGHQKEQQGYTSGYERDKQEGIPSLNDGQQENQEGHESSNQKEQQDMKSENSIYPQDNSTGHQELNPKYNFSHYGNQSYENNSVYQGNQQGNNLGHQKEQQRYTSGYERDKQEGIPSLNDGQQENQEGHESSNQKDQQDMKSENSIYPQDNSTGHQELNPKYNFSHYGNQSYENNSVYQGNQQGNNLGHQKEQQRYTSGYERDKQEGIPSLNDGQQENQEGHESSNQKDQQNIKSKNSIYPQDNSTGHQEPNQKYNLSHYGNQSYENNSVYQGNQQGYNLGHQKEQQRYTSGYERDKQEGITSLNDGQGNQQGYNLINQAYHQQGNNSSIYYNEEPNSDHKGDLQGYNAGYQETQQGNKSGNQIYQQENKSKNLEHQQDNNPGYQEYNQQGYNSINQSSQQPGLKNEEQNHNLQQNKTIYHYIQGSDRQDYQQGDTTSPGPVTVTSMGVIHGLWMWSRQGRRFEAYRGVRYAEAPIGELRFQPPKPIELYSVETDAREEGPACPAPQEGGVLLDEDCLRLNVYTPQVNRSDLLPVIVFIHPGGFYSMSGRSDILGPQYLMDRDLVLVTFNYRLASLGFLATGDELAPGNNGLKDQVVVLRWIQRNIIAFGGNPNLVTIAGYGSGSTSVALHMISPMSKGMFHRAISMSGSPTSKVGSPKDLQSLAVKQAQLVGCPYNSSKVIIDCLKTKSWKEIGDSLTGFFEFGYDPIELWVPNVEPDFGQERFLSIEPMDAIRTGKMHAVPYIVSQTEKEFYWLAINVFNNSTLLNRMLKDWDTLAPISFILPKNNSSSAVKRLTQAYIGGNFTNDTKSENGLGRLYGDSIIGFSVHRLANLMCRHSSQPVYYTQFNYSGNHSYWEDSLTKKPIGAMHNDELIYLFSQKYRFPDIQTSTLDFTISERMTAIFYNFARYGDPNPRGDLPELATLSWPQMKPEDRKYLRIDKEFSVDTNMSEVRLQVWDEIYPIQY